MSTLRPWSLRQRLSWWLAAQSLAGLGAVCLVVYVVTAMNLSERQHETLAQKETIVRHMLGSGQHKQDPSEEHSLSDFLIGHENFRLIVRLRDGQQVFPVAGSATESARLVSRMFEVAAPQTEGDEALQVTLSMDVTDDLQHLRRLSLTLAVAAIVGAIVVSLGGLSIVHIGLAPVRRLASQVQSLSANNLHQRLDSSGQPTELAPLVEQFNGLLGRLDQSYTQLEGFNADVAHELCTPLATLLASNELF